MVTKKIALKDAIAYLLQKGNKTITEKSKAKEYRQLAIEMMFILSAVYEKHSTNGEIIEVKFPQLEDETK